MLISSSIICHISKFCEPKDIVSLSRLNKACFSKLGNIVKLIYDVHPDVEIKNFKLLRQFRTIEPKTLYYCAAKIGHLDYIKKLDADVICEYSKNILYGAASNGQFNLCIYVLHILQDDYNLSKRVKLVVKWACKYRSVYCLSKISKNSFPVYEHYYPLMRITVRNNGIDGQLKLLEFLTSKWNFIVMSDIVEYAILYDSSLKVVKFLLTKIHPGEFSSLVPHLRMFCKRNGHKFDKDLVEFLINNNCHINLISFVDCDLQLIEYVIDRYYIQKNPQRFRMDRDKVAESSANFMVKCLIDRKYKDFLEYWPI